MYRQIRTVRKFRISTVLFALVILIAALTALTNSSHKFNIPLRFYTGTAYTDLPVISTDDWKLRLVNREHSLPDNFYVETGVTSDGYLFDKRAAGALDELLEAGRDAGFDLCLTSAYRTYDYQSNLYHNRAARFMQEGYSSEEAYVQAGTMVARPGESEHNLGLAADIVSSDYTELDDGYAETSAAIWLRENCAEYGFILRYMKDKQNITGIIFEPWHFRYVGVEAARYIMKHELSLEEFLDLY